MKGLKIDKYKRMSVKKGCECPMQEESWCMDHSRSGDCIMKEDYEFFLLEKLGN